MTEQDKPASDGSGAVQAVPDGPDAAARYELFEELGSGTSGIVVRAHDRSLGRDVAIKLLHADRPADSLRRLQRESRLAASFHHKNAVEVYDAGELDGRPFIAMELIRGESLGLALAREGVAPVASIVPIAEPIADVLAAAHALGLVHRDVKPNNIFLDGTLAVPGRIRLVDFGLAFMMVPTSGTVGRFTADGVIVGTPMYMAPEQAAGDAVGPPADVYALGCMLYELATGRTPFTGSVPRILTGHLYLPPMGFAELELDRELPAGLEDVVLHALEKDPARRPTAGDLAERLRELVGEVPPPVRSGGTTRAERMIEPALVHTSDETGPAIVRPRIAALDVALAAELAGAGVPMASALDANVIVVRLDDDGVPLGAGGSARAGKIALPIFGVHPAPTPRLIARAIQQGAIGVARWPGSAATLVERLRAAVSHNLRLPGD